MTIQTIIKMSYLEKLELRLLLEARYPTALVVAWEQPFELYAFAEAEHGSFACEQLLNEFGV